MEEEAKNEDRLQESDDEGNTLDFFESIVRICLTLKAIPSSKFVDLHLTGPDETELAGHQDTQKEAQEAAKMSTVKEAVKEKQEAQVGIWVLVCHITEGDFD